MFLMTRTYKICFSKKTRKKSSSRPFLAHPAAGQETPFYLRVALPGDELLSPGGRGEEQQVQDRCRT